MQAASNSNPLIGLAKGGIFNLLRHLFEKIYIAPVVQRELCEEGRGRPGDAELKQALGEGWIVIQAPAPPDIAKVTTRLKAEDREVVATALAVRAAFLLSDDLDVARAAAQHALLCLTTVDLLVLLRQRNHIPTLGLIFETLNTRGFHIGSERIQAALQKVGEPLRGK